MPIAYLCLIILAFISAQYHWPLTSIAVISATFLLVIDILIQGIRTIINKKHLGTLFGALALFFLSISYLFIWQFWVGSLFLMAFGFATTAAYFAYWYVAKKKINVRFSIIAFFFIVTLVFGLMNKSSLYCLKHHITRVHPHAPVYIQHKLAWFLYGEGQTVAAKNILEEERVHISARLRNPSRGAYYQKVFEENLAIVHRAIEEVNTHSWNYFEPLLPEDY